MFIGSPANSIDSHTSAASPHWSILDHLLKIICLLCTVIVVVDERVQMSLCDRVWFDSRVGTDASPGMSLHGVGLCWVLLLGAPSQCTFMYADLVLTCKRQCPAHHKVVK